MSSYMDPSISQEKVCIPLYMHHLKNRNDQFIIILYRSLLRPCMITKLEMMMNFHFANTQSLQMYGKRRMICGGPEIMVVKDSIISPPIMFRRSK